MACNVDESRPVTCEGTAELKVSLWSSEKIEPNKFKRDITRTLQSWANKNGIRAEIMTTEISEDGRTAVIRVTPPKALKELLDLSGKELTTKEKNTFSITPLTQAECNANPNKASEEVTKLTKSCSCGSGGVSFPLKIVGLKEWNDTLTFLQTTDRKCHITITSDEITVFGPQQYQVAISKLLRSTKINTDFTDKHREKERPGKDCTRIYTKRLTNEVDKKWSREAEAKKDEKEEETCPVCMDVFIKKTKLGKCKHEFCEECLKRSVKSMGAMCPVCKDVFGLVEGDQPDGTMKWRTNYSSLPGFDFCGSIEINYNIPGGTQTAKHPDPGKLYHGTQRTAYLPDNKEGNEVLMLLKKAFDQKLIFTIGTSRMSGAQNVVTWNDIHHKTSTHGGPQGFGYPDPHYLRRVKDELKAKGIK